MDRKKLNRKLVEEILSETGEGEANTEAEAPDEEQHDKSSSPSPVTVTIEYDQPLNMPHDQAAAELHGFGAVDAINEVVGNLPQQRIMEYFESVDPPFDPKVREKLAEMGDFALAAGQIKEITASLVDNYDPLSKALEEMEKKGAKFALASLDQNESMQNLFSAVKLPELMTRDVFAPNFDHLNDHVVPIETLPAPEIESPEPIPQGGDSCTSFTVVEGDSEQIASVLDEEFSRTFNPMCHLVPHKNGRYWHIEIFTGEEQEAKDLVRTIEQGELPDSVYAWDELEKKTSRIGYVHISNRPRIPVRFFIFEQEHHVIVESLAKDIAAELRQWEIMIEDPDSKADAPEDLMLDPLDVLNDFDVFEVGETLDGLISLVKSYLQSLGHVAESLTVQQKLRANNELRVEYSLAGCLLVIKTEVTKPGWTQVRPELLSWEEDKRKRLEALKQLRPHVQDLIDLFKKQLQWAPIKPTNRDLDEWFEFLHKCKAVGFKYTLLDLAADAGYSYGYVRVKHSEYKAEHEI